MKMNHLTLSFVNKEVKQIVADLLHIDVNSLELETPFLEMGADSLVLMEAINKLQARFHIKIPIRELFGELGTINGLINYIIMQHGNNTTVFQEDTPETEHVQKFPIKQQILQTVASVEMMDSENSYLADLGIEKLIKQQLDVISQQLALLKKNGQKEGLGLQSSFNRKDEDQKSTTKNLGLISSKDVHKNWLQRDLGKRVQSKKMDEHLNNLIVEYNKKTPKSKLLTQRYREVLADNRASAGFRLSTKEMIYPIIGTRSEGAYIWDKDNNKYIDFTMGFGTNLFGHTPSFIQNALIEQIGTGFQIGPQTELAGEVAQLMTELTGHERVAFCNSGSEAIMTAIRLARAVTNNNKIVIFHGSYHGVFDGVLARRTSENKLAISVPIAAGTPESFVSDVFVLDFGDEESLQVIQEYLGELAAIIVEPVQSRHPELQPKEFLRNLRKMTESAGVALIFDEVITGFRIGSGGAQKYFGVQADLATYGKIVGGGLPIGLVAGNQKFMNPIDGGMWQYGDNSYPKVEPIFFAGTFSKHPLAMTSAKAVLQKIKAEQTKIYTKLDQKTRCLAEQLNFFFFDEQIPIEIVHFGSLFRFKYYGNYDLLFYHLMLHGIFIWEGRNCFVSTAHSDDDIQAFIKAVQDSVKSMKKDGYFGKDSATITPLSEWFSLSDSQQRFVQLAKLGNGKKTGNIGFVIKLKENLEANVLCQAWEALLDRHECLNYIIDIDQEKQKVNSQKVNSFSEINLSHSGGIDLESFLVEQAQQDFNLANGSLVQAVFIRKNLSESYLCVVAHHTISDGWSFAIIVEELFKNYQALQNHKNLQLLPAQSYRNYVIQERESLSLSALQYWVEKHVSNPPEKLFDINNSDAEIFEGRRLRRFVKIDPTHHTFKKLVKKFKCTSFILLFSLLQSYLYQHFTQKRFTVAIPIAKREMEDGSSLLGCCVNLLPIICDNKPDSNSIEQLIKNTKKDLVEAITNKDFSLNRWLQIISRELNIPGYQPIQIYFNLEPKMNFSPLIEQQIELISLPISYVEFPLMLNILQLNNQLQIELDYQSRYFSQADAEDFLAVFTTKIEQLFE